MTKRKTTLALCLALALSSAPRDARAGGFELPDNGTEALGRGGAFVAKADDPTAIDYNPAGLAEQRGTRVLLDGHIVNSSYSFKRFGAYPDNPGDPATPWGGFAFPSIKDTGGPFFAPFLAVTTDFGTLDWLTVAVGVYGPSGVGNRTYAAGVDTVPAPSRYDVVQPTSTIILPTASVGVKPFDWLDLGVSLHLVDAVFDLSSTSFVDLGDGPTGPCKNYEYQPCDSLSSLHATATGFAATPGILVKPTRNLSFGLSARTPITLSAHNGVVTVLTAPLGQPIPTPGNATLSTQLPWYWRFGARYALLEGDGFEQGDLELDGTYETWGSAQATGPEIHIDHLGPSGPAFDDININVAHHYNDTFSIRAGGAYNARLPMGILTVRLGAYYDKSATADNPGYTRLDFDTLDKIAGTVGVGFKWDGLSFNVAYADVFEPGRTVAPGTGQIRPIDGAQHGASVDSNGSPLPAVNEGQYAGHTDIFSFSVVAVFDEILGTKRSKTWAPKPVAAPAPPKTEQKPAKDDAEPESKNDAAKTDDEVPPPPRRTRPNKSSASASSPGAERSPSSPAATPAKKSDWND
ncbi:MAG TPA: outer membrane protein transport protein [Polyangiaceae bacterium]|jgi:long-chain fatty acid transport protein